jgi:hypothetical protein
MDRVKNREYSSGENAARPRKSVFVVSKGDAFGRRRVLPVEKFKIKEAEHGSYKPRNQKTAFTFRAPD